MSEHVVIPGPVGSLEGRLRGPVDGPPVLLLHPHPLFEGSMGSRLTYDLWKALAAAGYRCLRFNFRGVGGSDGGKGQGDEEVADAKAAFAWLQDQCRGAAPVVLGHSFGGGVAVRLATREQVAGLVVVGTPLEVSASTLAPLQDAPNLRPTAALVIVGDQDEFVTPAEARRLAASLKAAIEVLSGAGHFLEPSHNGRVVDAVAAWLANL